MTHLLTSPSVETPECDECENTGETFEYIEGVGDVPIFCSCDLGQTLLDVYVGDQIHRQELALEA